MTILQIETSTNVCSIALSHNSDCVFEISNREGLNHATLLSPFVQKALEKIKESGLSLDAVSVSGGPGSYTGLRIGVSTAKGLCFGFDVPLISIDTLQILCENVLSIEKPDENSLLCPMIDARRMEVYTALYKPNLEIVENVSAKVITLESFSELLEKHVIYFFGNGAEKCKPLLTHPNAKFISEIEPLAKHMIHLSEKKFANNEFVDVAYFEPFYLKEFQATIPKNLLKG